MALWTRSRDLERRAEWLSSQTFVVLAIQVPKNNDKTPQSAEQFFAAVHGIFRNDPIVQEHISFEIVAKEDSITFYVFTPIHLREFVEGQLYAQYPSLQIKQVSDYTKSIPLEGLHVATSKIQLTKEDVYPIKTFTASEVDPLAGITAVMSNLDEREQIWFQMVAKPVGDNWQNRGVKYVQDVKAGKTASNLSGGFLVSVARLLLRVAQEFISPGSGAGATAKPAEPPKLSAPQEAALKGIESKVTKLGFETVFRLVIISPDVNVATSRTQALLAAFKQYNTTNLNGFIGGEIKIDDYASWEKFITREFEEKGNILNIEELASIYHFPSQSVETSAISWAGSKKGVSPFNLPLKEEIDPKMLTVIGKTDYRERAEEFGIKLDDRMRHVYVIGKSGTGKSTLLENMIIDDIHEGRGIIVVDPHGELADKVIDAVPENRIRDVVVFDPSDREFPIAFNILDITHEDQKGNIASGFVAGLKKIFGNSWGPRLEYILRNATLAILDAENPTMLGIPRMLTDPGFRNSVIPQIKDPVVLDFWKNEWAAKDQKQQVEEMGSILNKVGQFLSTSLIRNIVGQPKSGFDMRRVMDEKKILVVNLSKGKIGEDNSALLGTMMITKVQLAAMSRADVNPKDRPECFLYVDEFQNFATESFATILSEARKYNLGLTIAHQYIAQMSPEVKDAVFGNVGTMISFRVGSEDATALKPEFAPVFDESDLVNLQRGFVYIKLLIDGLAVPAFSAQTLPPKHLESSHRGEVIEFSRSSYARTKEDAEALIDETAGYRQKREAEQASKKAQELLNQGAGMAIRPGGQGAVGGAGGRGSYSVPTVPPAPAQPVVYRQGSTMAAAAPSPAPAVPRAPAAAPVAAASAPVAPVATPAPVSVPAASVPAATPTPEPAPVSSPLPPAEPAKQVADSTPAPPTTEEKPNIEPEPTQEEIKVEPEKPETPEIPIQEESEPEVDPTPSESTQEREAAGEQFEPQAEEGGEPAPKPPRPEKPLKVIDGWVYKETSQRGGMKWFLGEKEEEVKARLEEKRRLKEEAAAAGEGEFAPEASPVSLPPASEQNPNIHSASAEVVLPHADDYQAVVVEPVDGAVSLQEGKSVLL